MRKNYFNFKLLVYSRTKYKTFSKMKLPRIFVSHNERALMGYEFKKFQSIWFQDISRFALEQTGGTENPNTCMSFDEIFKTSELRLNVLQPLDYESGFIIILEITVKVWHCEIIISSKIKPIQETDQNFSVCIQKKKWYLIAMNLCVQFTLQNIFCLYFNNRRCNEIR